MLRDPSGLSADYIGVADRVQKGSLTVVNMTHNAHYRRTFLHLLLIFVFLFQKLFDDVHDFLFLAQDVIFQCDLLCRFIINLLVYRHNLSLHKQFLHDHGRHDLHLIGQLFKREYLRNHNRLDRLFYLLHFLLRFLHLRFLVILPAFALRHPLFLVAAVFFFLVIVFSFSFASLSFLSLDCRSRYGRIIFPPVSPVVAPLSKWLVFISVAAPVTVSVSEPPV